MLADVLDPDLHHHPHPLPPHIRVFIALHEVPDSEPLETVAWRANVTMTELREAMTRLGQREPDAEA